MQTAPMLRILPPLAAGILTGTYLDIPTEACLSALAACFCTALVFRTKSWADIPLYLSIALFGAAITCAQSYSSDIPEGRHKIELQIIKPLSATSSPRTLRTEAHCGAWKDSTGAWHECREKISVYIDTSHSLGVGEQIICDAYLSSLSDSTTSYTRLMNSRGFFRRAYIPAYAQTVRSSVRPHGIDALSSRLQGAAAERLRGLGMPDQCGEICVAMTAGDRSGISRNIRKAYSDTGAAHLLAVSGLHVGIVFVIINALLYLLPFFRYGHIIKNLAATSAVWGFVVMSGMAPSAIRAAVMFTALQLSAASGSAYNSVNALCAAAVVMLAARPSLLLDTGFQMSFTAVAAIIFWFPPAMALVRCRWKLLNALWATVIIGLVASAALAPIAAYQFGRIPLTGFLLNPALMLTAHTIVLVSLLRITVPLPALASVAEAILSFAAGLQNSLVETLASMPSASIPVRIPLAAVLAIYAIMIAATAILHAGSRKPSPLIPSR